LGEAGAGIDQLYRQILDNASQRLTKSECRSLDNILGTIVLSKDPLRYADLQRISQMSDTRTQLILGNLSPIISIYGSAKFLRVCHKSVADFLLDRERSESFAIDCATQNANLAQACLRLMNQELKFNILGLETSGLFNDDIPNRDTRVKSAISTALVHSSLYWAEYLEGISGEDLDCSALRAELRRFLHEHFLHWLEVLSLMNAVHRAPGLLIAAAKWIGVSAPHHDPTCGSQVRFILVF